MISIRFLAPRFEFLFSYPFTSQNDILFQPLFHDAFWTRISMLRYDLSCCSYFYWIFAHRSNWFKVKQYVIMASSNGIFNKPTKKEPCKKVEFHKLPNQYFAENMLAETLLFFALFSINNFRNICIELFLLWKYGKLFPFVCYFSSIQRRTNTTIWRIGMRDG